MGVRTAGVICLVIMAALALAGCTSLTSSPSHRPGTPAGPATAVPTAALASGFVPHASPVSGGGEPLILADRAGKFLWVGDTTGVYYSTDNGTSWHASLQYSGDVGFVFGDGAALAQDEKGRLYEALLHDNRADIARSDDGTSFTSMSLLAGLPVDRPWISAHGDTVTMVYLNNLGAVGFAEACTQSTDAGVTFIDRNPSVGNPVTGGMVADGSGASYFTSSGTLVRLPGNCRSGTESKDMFAGGLGVNNMIQVASNGTSLHVAAANGDNAIVLSSLRDWRSTPKTLRLSPGTLGTNTFAAVAARGNDVSVAWYGSTASGDPSAAGFTGDFNVYLATVHDPFGDKGGPFIAVQQLTTKPNHHGQICMSGVTCTGARGLLDYFGVAIDVWGGTHVAYVDDTGSTTVLTVHVLPSGQPVSQPTNTSSATPSSTRSGTLTPGPTGNKPLVARFNGTTRGLTVKVDASASTGNGPLAYAWAWGDGSFGQGIAASHTYATAGKFTVTLRVTDQAGHSAQSASTLSVDPTTSGTVGPPASGGAHIKVPAPSAALAALGTLGVATALRRRSRRT